MRIGLIGAGRLGLCLALLMEKAGYDVIASDVREDYVKGLNMRLVNTTEPYVQEQLLNANPVSYTHLTLPTIYSV